MDFNKDVYSNIKYVLTWDYLRILRGWFLIRKIDEYSGTGLNKNVFQRTPSPASSGSTYMPAASEVGSTGKIITFL